MSARRPVVLLALLSAFACSERGSDVAAEAAEAAAASAVVDAEAAASRDEGSGINISVSGSRRGDSGNSKPTFTEGPDGSASMHTASGALVMSLRHDSIVVAFSDSIRQSVKSEVNRSLRDSGNVEGEASAFKELVKGVVEKSVSATMTEVFDKARGFPVSALRDVQYENGAIRFDYVEKPTWTFDSFKTDHTPLLEQFHPADAARFVGAVRARLKQS